MEYSSTTRMCCSLVDQHLVGRQSTDALWQWQEMTTDTDYNYSPLATPDPVNILEPSMYTSECQQPFDMISLSLRKLMSWCQLTWVFWRFSSGLTRFNVRCHDKTQQTEQFPICKTQTATTLPILQSRANFLCQSTVVSRIACHMCVSARHQAFYRHRTGYHSAVQPALGSFLCPVSDSAVPDNMLLLLPQNLKKKDESQIPYSLPFTITKNGNWLQSLQTFIFSMCCERERLQSR